MSIINRYRDKVKVLSKIQRARQTLSGYGEGLLSVEVKDWTNF